MSIFDQLDAMERLLSDLLDEQDDEVLRAKLREDTPRQAELEPQGFPLEVFSAGSLYLIEYYAHRLRERLHGRMGVPRGTAVVGMMGHGQTSDPETGDVLGEFEFKQIQRFPVPRTPPKSK